MLRPLATLVCLCASALCLDAQEAWLDDLALDHLERMERFEEGQDEGLPLEPRAADAYFASAIFLAGRIPASAVDEFLLPARLARANDIAHLMERAQAVGELAQLRAFFYEREARWDEARAIRLAALASGLQLGVSRPMLLIGQAQAEENLGSIGQALEYAARAEEALFLELDARVPGFASAHSQILGVKGELYVVLGLLDRAQPLMRASLNLAEELGDAELLVAAYTRQAMLLGAAQQAQALKRLMQRCLADERISGDKRLLVALSLRLGICLASIGDPMESGAEHLELAARSESLSPLERFRAQAWLGNLALRGKQLERAGHWLAQAEESIALHQNRLPPARELAFLEALRAKLAVAAGSSRAQLQAAHDRLQAAYDGFLANWQATPILRGGVAFLRYPSRILILNQLVQLKLLLQPGELGVEASWQVLHRAQAQGTSARRASYQLASLAELRQGLLGKGEGLLVFLPGEDACHWFALDQESLSHASLPPILELRSEQAQLFARITAQPAPGAAPGPEPRLQALLHSMSAQLLPPSIKRKLESWSAVTVIGLDLLGYAPLEQLPFDQERLLDDVLPISYLQSLPIGMLLKQRADPLAEELALDLHFHGPPNEAGSKLASGDSAGIEPLPIHLDDAQWKRLSAAFASDRVRLDRGAAATHANLQGAHAPQARITHLLTHGLPGDGLIRTVELLLGASQTDADVRLTCAEADDLELGSLVIVSACNAGQGPLRQGEDGGVGFGGAFLQGSRTRAVVLSPAKLDLLAQYRMIPVFYERLAQGDSPAQALRAARRFLRLDPSYSHPYYSLMHLLGLGNEPVFPAGR